MNLMKWNRCPQVDHTILKDYRSKQVLITGGLGFIGSNLAQVLVREAGACVSILDNQAAHCGSNLRNLEGIEKDLTLHLGDIGDSGLTRRIIRNTEVIFNLAGSISHVDSMSNPHQDLWANAGAHLSLLESCRQENPGVRIIFASTRQIYGRPTDLPVSETHLTNPIDFNGVHKLIGEDYHRLFQDLCGLRPTFLRLTNTFGPRQLLRHPRQGFIGWFIRQAILGEEIELYGGGSQLRDFTYVDDVLSAMLMAALSERTCGQTYNLGWGIPISIRELVNTLRQIKPEVRYRTIEFPADRKSIDIGSYYADCSRIRDDLGWIPKIRLQEGLQRTLEFYEDQLSGYLP